MADEVLRARFEADNSGFIRAVAQNEQAARRLEAVTGATAQQARNLEKATGGAATRLQAVARQAANAIPSLTGFGGSLSQIVGIATRFGPAALLAGGLFATLRTGEPALRETERAMRSVAVSLSGIGVNFRGVEEQVEQTIGRLERLTGVSDAELARAFSRLVQITGTYRTSLDALETVADLAAARQMSLREAAEVVGRALNGQAGSLRQYAITVREGASQAEVLAAIQKQVGGQARVNVEAADRLTIAWENFAKSIASKVKPAWDALREAMAAVLESVTETQTGVEEAMQAAEAAVAAQLAGQAAGIRDPAGAQRFAEQLRHARAAARAEAAELFREGRRGVVTGEIQAAVAADTQGARRAAQIFADMEAAMARAARQASFLGTSARDVTQLRLQGEIEAVESALKQFAEQGVARMNPLVVEATERLKDLRAALEAVKREAKDIQSIEPRFDQFVTERTFETRALVERRAAGQAMIDAVFAEMAEQQLELDEQGARAWADLMDRKAQEAERAAERITRANERAATQTQREWERTGDRVLDVFETIARGGSPGEALRGAGFSFASELLREQVRAVLARRAGVSVPTGGGLNLGSLLNLGGLFGGGGAVPTAQAALPNAGIELGAGLQGAGGAAAGGLASLGPALAVAAPLVIGGAAIGLSRSRRARRRAQIEALRQEFAPFAQAARAIAEQGLVTLTGAAASAVAFIEHIRSLGDRAGAESAKQFLERWRRIAEPLSQSVQGGLAEGIRAFLNREGNMLRRLREGVRSAIVDAFTQATIQGTVVRGAFGDLLGRLSEGLARGQDVTGLIPQIAAILPALAQQLEAVLAPLRTALERALPRGSFQTGTAFVPETGPYILHRGEAVIPAGARPAGGPVHVHVHVGETEVAQVVFDRLLDRVVEAFPLRARFRYGMG
ncbi:MAG TPA: hypothetical protein VF406_16200 [Thermodesulfobacteriota bacterium]